MWRGCSSGTTLDASRGITLMGFDFYVVVEFTMFSQGHDATWDDPAEGPEYQIDKILLHRDEVGFLGPPFEATGELYDVIAPLLEDDIVYACGQYEPYWEY